MVSIDLTDVDLFDENHIDFDRKSVFIYGRNGTGKSTLTKIIEDQLCVKYDVSVFQGVDNLIDEEEKLNVVLLGEENVKINQKIKFLEKDIEEINEKADFIKKQISIDLSVWQRECNAWLDKAIKLLHEKRVNVFRRMENLAMDTPESLKSIADRYNILLRRITSYSWKDTM